MDELEISRSLKGNSDKNCSKAVFTGQSKLKQKLNPKMKSKTKSHRPIILLRRNSSGSIPNKASLAKSRTLATKMPRLKSTTEIEVKRHLQDSQNAAEYPKVKTECVPEYSSYEAMNASGESSETNLHMRGIKAEFAENCQPGPWLSSSPRQSIMQQTPDSSSMQPKNSMLGVNFATGVSEHFVKQEAAPLQPCDVNFSPYPCSTQQFQNMRPLSVPANNTNMKTYLPNMQENFTADAQCGRFVFPAANNLSRNIAPDFSMPPNRINYFQPTLGTSMLPQGTVLQQVSPPGTFQVQTHPTRPNQPLQINSYDVRTKFGDAVVDDSLTNITWLGRMGVNNFMPVPIERERRSLERSDKRGRPPYSYMALIQFAINSSPTGRMTLRQIYQWIEEKFPYFKNAKPGWKNSIRHNLSLHDIFVREVTTGSKASYWTLREDLNMRPLTLDSVRGGEQHAFQDTSNMQGPVWSLQTCAHGQKPILPRLPQCSRPYILLPVPLLQPHKKDSTFRKTECAENLSQEMASSSSSLLVDSGFNSDLSQCTPTSSSRNYSLFASDAASLSQDDSSSIMLKDSGNEPSPLLSQSNVISSNSSKRSRKEPLKTLNDSLNSSLHFLKEEVTSTPAAAPPPRRCLSPSGEQFLLCKKVTKKARKKETELLSKATAVGLSDESFSELLNDLGSPFKSYLTQGSVLNFGASPQITSTRKRRRSWGSPESSSSSGDLQQRLRVANERTPMSQQIRRVKSEAGDLSKSVENDDAQLPTSTPLCKDKWKKMSQQRYAHDSEFGNEENINPNRLTPIKRMAWPVQECEKSMSIPSPIHASQQDSDIEIDFFKDIMGSVFKTPDKASAPIRHFDSFSPQQAPFTDITARANEASLRSGFSGECSSHSKAVGFSALTPSKEEPLDTSFSKLLDISGGSGSFARFNTNFSDVADLNLSWSNLYHF